MDPFEAGLQLKGCLYLICVYIRWNSVTGVVIIVTLNAFLTVSILYLLLYTILNYTIPPCTIHHYTTIPHTICYTIHQHTHYNRPAVGELGGDPVEAEMFDKDSEGNIQLGR